MRNSVKISAAALAAAALVSISTLGASAVGEVGLPNDGDRLMVLTCDDSFPYALGQVDTATGIVTPIGEQTTNQCWSQGAYNPADGLIYAVDWNHGIDGFPQLSTIDPDTGIVAAVGPVTDLRNDLGVNQYAVAIDADGNAFVSSDSELFSLDLATGDASFIGHFNDGDDVSPAFYSFAFNPITNVLYGVWWDTQDLYSIDAETGAMTLIDSTWNDVSGEANASLAFDSSGMGWFQSEHLTGFFAADVTDIEGTRSTAVAFSYNDANFYAESLIYVPAATDVAEEEALAETGVDAGLVGTAALAFAMAAAGIAVTRMRRNS